MVLFVLILSLRKYWSTYMLLKSNVGGIILERIFIINWLNGEWGGVNKN